ncbi:MAG: phytoene desaturase family protein [Gammaproteobacteria bacterium]
MKTQRVVVVGAGIAGLVTSLELATRGVEVIVVERADHPGGKMREIRIGDARIDAGPTVFTMRWVFEEIFAAAASSLAEHLTLKPVRTLARHAWSEYERLDLFADVDESAAAIGEFSGVAEARRYREFCARARGIFDTLEEPFLRAPGPSLPGLVRRAGLHGLGKLWRISPFATLWRALGEHFHDVRLRQLFARYATYCGSSPFLAPATLMLVAHVEREGVWLVEGGMHSVAVALARLAAARGACFRYGAEVGEVFLRGSRVGGVMLATGERIEADAVVVNADVAAVAASRFGHQIAAAVAPVPPAARSLSALTWAMVAACEGFPRCTDGRIVRAARRRQPA